MRRKSTCLKLRLSCEPFDASSRWAGVSRSYSYGGRTGLGLTGRVPGPVTIWRVLTGVDRAALKAAIGAWLRGRLEVTDDRVDRPAQRRPVVRRVLAVDGKAMRATCHDQSPVHLLGVHDHARGVVLAQVDVDAKTNDIPLFATLLGQIEDPPGAPAFGLS